MATTKAYIVGSTTNTTSIDGLRKELADYGLEPLNLDSIGLNPISFLRAKILVDLSGDKDSKRIRIGEKIGKGVVTLSEIRKMNAKKSDDRRIKVLGFVERAVANKKIAFPNDDPRIDVFLEVTEALGVIWKEEIVLETDDNPFGIDREEERRFYIYKSERDGYLFGVKGGTREYFDHAGEALISPEEFIEAVEDSKIRDLIRNQR